MSEELAPLETFEKIKHAPTIYVGCYSDVYTMFPHECRLIESALKEYNKAKAILSDNQYYRFMICHICHSMGIDINPLEDIVKTNNLMMEYVRETRQMFKAIKIIREKVNPQTLLHLLAISIKDQEKYEFVRNIFL